MTRPKRKRLDRTSVKASDQTIAKLDAEAKRLGTTRYAVVNDILGKVVADLDRSSP